MSWLKFRYRRLTGQKRVGSIDRSRAVDAGFGRAINGLACHGGHNQPRTTDASRPSQSASHHYGVYVNGGALRGSRTRISKRVSWCPTFRRLALYRVVWVGIEPTSSRLSAGLSTGELHTAFQLSLGWSMRTPIMPLGLDTLGLLGESLLTTTGRTLTHTVTGCQ